MFWAFFFDFFCGCRIFIVLLQAFYDFRVGMSAKGVNSTIVKNITSLGVLQIANYLIPLIVIPFITRIFGTEVFGRVSYAQNIVVYLTLIVNYGFEYSATRQIALAKDDLVKSRQLFWSVISMKSMLLAASFVLLGILALTVDRIAADPMLYVCTALVNVGVVFFPTWYLQGVQNMTKMAIFNLTIKLLGAILILSIIRNAGQYQLYPLFLSVASMLVGVVAFWYVVKHYGLGGWIWDKSAFAEVARAGFPIFLNNVFVSLYTTINLTILGGFADDVQIGYFSGAQRLIIAANMCVVMPISTAVFPEMSRRFAESYGEWRRFFGRTLVIGGAIALCVSTVAFVLAPFIVRVMLGSAFAESVPLLRILSPLPFLVMTATILTVQGLYGQGLQRFAPFVGIVLAILCMSSNLLLIPRIGVGGAAWSWVIAEVAECVIVGVILIWHRRKCSI